jgi:hypothetical protein
MRFAAVALVACGTATVEPPVPPADRQLDAVTLPGLRARLARVGDARWSPAGEAIELDRRELERRPELAVAMDLGAAVRVILEDRSTRAVAWVRRDSLARVPVRRVAVAPGLELEPGAVVELGERRGNRRRIAVATAAVRFAGWIDEAALGEVYRPEREPEAYSDGRVAANTDVLATTAGPVIATLGATHAARDPDVDAPAGYVAIAWRDERIAVRGLIAERAFEPHPRWLRVPSADVMDAAAITDTPFATLRAGAAFYDRGHAIGRVSRDATVYLWGKPGPWTPVLVSVPILGFVKASVRADDIVR